MTTNPRVAVESQLDDQTFAFVYESHFLNHALNRARLHDLRLTYGITELAADFNALEVLSEIIACE